MSDLNEVSYKLGQIDGKLDTLLEAMRKHIEDDEKKHGDIDERMGTLERGRAWLMGVGAAISFLFALIWNFLMESG